MSDGSQDPNNLYSGEIDPEIAALLGDTLQSTKPSKVPSFEDLMGDRPARPSGGGAAPAPGSALSEAAAGAADLSRRSFDPILKFFEDKPAPWLHDKDYYKTALGNDGDEARKVHRLLSDFLNAPDSERRSEARLRLIPAWWDWLNTLAPYVGPGMAKPQQLVLRFGLLAPNLLTPEQREMITKTVWDNQTGEALHYVDEWLRKVATGEVAPLAMDEEPRKVAGKKADTSALTQKLEKLQGQLAAQTNLVMQKQAERAHLERQIHTHADQLQAHAPHPAARDLQSTYDASQRQALFGIQETLKRLSGLDKEIESGLRDVEKAAGEVDSLKQKISAEEGDATVDAKAAVTEVQSLRQVHKLTCGRQGNHFPAAIKNYLPPRAEELGTRERVLSMMAEVERLDPGLFMRSFKGHQNRIVPHIILLPSYGDYGVCWEPFEKFNRSTSRGRVAIPMFSKNLRMAVIIGMADLRWQVAKEKAGYHWMDPAEGITGLYYTWFEQRKMKGDIRMYFINDYLLWITKESEGTQKLDKEVRGIFWRNMPYPQDVRENLKNRGFVYNELYKKDINRSLSDGY